MGKPPRYPNSAKTVSERIPVRFCKQVRHFLETLDQLNTDFEVRCTVYQAGARQPMQLIYTELEASTLFSAETEDLLPLTGTASQNGAIAHPEAALLPTDRGNGFTATVSPDSSTADRTLLSQNGAGLGATFDTTMTAVEGEADTDPLSRNGLTLSTGTQSNEETDSLPAVAPPSADWEHTFRGEASTTLVTGKRPPTLTQILQGTYNSQRDAEAVDPQPLTFDATATEPDSLTDDPTEPTPVPIPIDTEPVVGTVLPLEATGRSTEAETTVPLTTDAAQDTAVLQSPVSDRTTEAPTLERSAIRNGNRATTPTAGQATEQNWPTLEMSAITRFRQRQTQTRAVTPVAPTTRQPVEPRPEPFTAPSDDRSVADDAIDIATPWPTVESAVQPTATAVDAALSDPHQVVAADDGEARTDDHRIEGEGPPTLQAPNQSPDLTSNQATNPTPDQAPDLPPELLPETHPHHPSPVDQTATAEISSLDTLGIEPSPTEAQTALTADGDAPSATGASEVEPLEASHMTDQSEADVPSAMGASADLTHDRCEGDLPSATGNEPAVTATPLPVVDASLPAGDDGMIAATVSATVTQLQAGDLPSATGETEAMVKEPVLDQLAQPPSPLSVDSETGANESAVLLLATADGSALPPAASLNGSVETGYETAVPLLESQSTPSELPLPEASAESLDAPSASSQQAVVLSYTLPVDANPFEPVLQRSDTVTDPVTKQEDGGTETHLETALPAQAADESGLESETIASDSPPTPISPSSASVLLSEALTEHCDSASVPNRHPQTEALNSTNVLTAAATDIETVGPLSLSEETPPARTPVQGESTDSGNQAIAQKVAPVELSGSDEEAFTAAAPAMGTAAATETISTVEASPECAEALDDDPTALPTDKSPSEAETPSLVTVEPPDQGFAEDLFVVWRRLALQQSPTVWGVVVSLEDLYAQGFSTWMAPHFIGNLAAAEGRTVTWGCSAQLVNEPDYLQQTRERYQVGGKEVTGLTFQSPNARTNLLETIATPTLKPFAQSPTLLSSFNAEPLEADRPTDSPVESLTPIAETPSSQETEVLSPVKAVHSLNAATTRDEEEEPLPANRPRRRWREGLRLLLGR